MSGDGGKWTFGAAAKLAEDPVFTLALFSESGPQEQHSKDVKGSYGKVARGRRQAAANPVE
jgi:hypothetical protein